MAEMSTQSDREARTLAVRALEGEFSDLIALFRRRITENANRVSPGMLPGAYKVFTTIARHEPVTQSALAEMLAVDKGQLSRTVRELADLDLIERTPDPTDGRSSLLSATARGHERLADARGPQEGALLEALSDWRVEDIENLAHLLHALVAGSRPDGRSLS
ncbi:MULTISPECIES: MarR family winged helix-turn-helix transcriptional regulator [Microbacterium]|uniref:MarR family transcriptional regulator n=1 Tax=Microbacterium aquilitoris TaxID=3067307 RepID=A0ABU3GHB5_9MICO|nr:MarR family transcriptional regulator [Microbacterium sp. KSW-18]MDT3330099.1 MarR family transcriptional regulator [Microbacterium sp. KSW-18]